MGGSIKRGLKMEKNKTYWAFNKNMLDIAISSAELTESQTKTIFEFLMGSAAATYKLRIEQNPIIKKQVINDDKQPRTKNRHVAHSAHSDS